jgi:hypothetical protein
MLTRLLFAGLVSTTAACGDSASSPDGGDGGNGAAGSTGSNGTPGAGGFGEGGTPSLEGCSVFPADNPWNQDVSALPVHPSSDSFIDAIGRDTTLHPDFGTEWEGAPIGIPFVTVSGTSPLVPVEFVAYPDESDPGPYPVPPNAPIEGGGLDDGDRHVIVVDVDNCKLYELYRAFPVADGASWEADSGAVFDLSINDHHPDTWTSADAAGLPVFPGLVKYQDIVVHGVLDHAVRFTVSNSQAGYIFPARHYASSDSDPSLPPMGLRLRMKAGYDCSGYATEVQIMCTGFKKYGMIVADNGADWYVSGEPDPRWNDDALGDLGNIPGDAFEVVYTGDVQTY